MANLKDYEDRTQDQGAQEETRGIPQEGFYDPNGEFPKHEAKGKSSINSVALGTSTNELRIGGGDTNGEIDIPSVIPSQYPHNQVKETASGHIVEYDDTPGNERVVIRHRTGSGIECRPDGSVIVSTLKNKVEVINANETVIVEGDGNLVYKGNLNLNVTGDFNLNVGGSYNVTVGGDKEETIKHSSSKTIIQDETVLVKGSSTKDIEGEDTLRIRGSQHYTIDSDQTFLVGNNFKTVVLEDHDVMARNVDHSFVNGVIGGSNVDLYGHTMTATTFKGDLTGRADEAIAADTAVYASYGGGPGSAEGWTNTNDSSEYSVFVDSDSDRTVRLSTLNTAYSYLMNSVPETEEARSKLRSPSNASDTVFTDALVEGGIISANFASTSVPNTGRREGKTNAPFKGQVPVGSNPPTIDVKSIIV